MGAITQFAAKLVKIFNVMSEEMPQRIELEGNTYTFQEGDFYDFIVHSKAATLIYKHLDSQPHWEDYEFDKEGTDLQDYHRNWEEISLPILRDESGEELDPEETGELYGIDEYYLVVVLEYRDFNLEYEHEFTIRGSAWRVESAHELEEECKKNPPNSAVLWFDKEHEERIRRSGVEFKVQKDHPDPDIDSFICVRVVCTPKESRILDQLSTFYAQVPETEENYERLVQTLRSVLSQNNLSGINLASQERLWKRLDKGVG